MPTVVQSGFFRLVRSQYAKKGIDFLMRNKLLFLVMLCGAVFVDGLFIPRSSDTVYFGILMTYVILTRVWKTKSDLTFLLCLGIFVSLGVNFLRTSASSSTEKFAVWLFLFMAVGVWQGWSE